MSTRQAVAVLGGGAWGGVLAAIAARATVTTSRCGRSIVRQPMRSRAIGPARERSPGFRLPPEVVVSSDLDGTVAGRDMLLLAVPSEFVAATLRAAAPMPPRAARCAIVVCASKGLEPVTGATMAEVIAGNLSARAGGRAVGAELRRRDRPRAAGGAGGGVDGRGRRRGGAGLLRR